MRRSATVDASIGHQRTNGFFRLRKGKYKSPSVLAEKTLICLNWTSKDDKKMAIVPGEVGYGTGSLVMAAIEAVHCLAKHIVIQPWRQPTTKSDQGMLVPCLDQDQVQPAPSTTTAGYSVTEMNQGRDATSVCREVHSSTNNTALELVTLQPHLTPLSQKQSLKHGPQMAKHTVLLHCACVLTH